MVFFRAGALWRFLPFLSRKHTTFVIMVVDVETRNRAKVNILLLVLC
jgi:hypothetical protein